MKYFNRALSLSKSQHLMRRNAYYNFQCNIRSIYNTHLLNEKYFTKKHEWISLEGNCGTVGISNYAQESLGDIVYVQLPESGSTVSTTVDCGTVESVKSASELYSPMSGTVTDINTELEEKPELINVDCYGKGWLFKLNLTNPQEIDQLLNENQYNEFVKVEKDSH